MLESQNISKTHLAGLLGSVTKTASVASCPGKCIHALASLMCDTVLEEVSTHVIMTSNFDFIGCHLLIYQISLIFLVSLHTLIFTALRNSILILFPGTMSHKQYEVLRREKWRQFLLLGILDTRTGVVDASEVKTSSLLLFLFGCKVFHTERQTFAWIEFRH